MILVYIGRWSYGRFQDDNKVFQKIKNDPTTGTWQDNIWCPINIILLGTSDGLIKRIQSHKDSYNKSLGLPRLFNSLWELQKHFQQLAWNSNYSGYCRLRSLRLSMWNLLWMLYSAIEYLSNGAINRYRSMHYLTSTGLLRSLVRTLRHAIQLQCHQSELLAIVET